MIEHTTELWTTQRGVFGEEVVSLDRNNFSTFVANCGTNADSGSNALQIVADHKAALAAPHECDDPDCPGNVNRRKLAAFDGLLAAFEVFTGEVEALHRSLGPHRCEDVRPVCPDIDAARAAIASAKQTAPAEGARGNVMAERPQYDDPEIEALATIRDALQPFSLTVRGRILRYAMDRLHHESLEAATPATTEKCDG